MIIGKGTGKDQDFTHPYFLEEFNGTSWETFGRYTEAKECERVYNDVCLVHFPHKQFRMSVLPEYKAYLASKGLLGG